MIVSELGNRVTRALVDGAGHFSTLNVNDAEVHVCRRDDRCERFIAVTDDEHEIGLQTVELARKLHYAESDGFCHRGGCRALQFDKHLAVYAKTIAAHQVNGLAKPLQD